MMSEKYTPRDCFCAALECRPISGRVPTFELVFFLTMEAFGKVHPRYRYYYQWDQMRESERVLHRKEIARLYVDIAERYSHSAIVLKAQPDTLEETLRLINLVREISGLQYFLAVEGDATLGIPVGKNIEEFSFRLVDEPEAVKQEAEARINAALERAEKLRAHGGLDGFVLCADYCFNTGPFLSPTQFSEFVTPYLTRLIAGYRQLGFYTIKHTDGNIMPILDQLLQTHPHALHSLDPQAGVSMRVVRQIAGNKLCLIGNVNCSLLHTGSREEIIADVRRALQEGMQSPGYIFSSSNCIYAGMPLENYELMLDIWRREGDYPRALVS